jgi:indolepyruvate ferredoxin oxidoreductase alpha subunit
MGMPVMVRITRALALAEGELVSVDVPRAVPPFYQREFMRWVVLPVNVVAYHRRLHERLQAVQARFERSPLNGVEGHGSHGVIAAGYAYRKLLDLLGGIVPSALRILHLGTPYPLPGERVRVFLRETESVTILEENAPIVERAVRATAQMAGQSLPIYGRDTGHLDGEGEIFGPHIARALNRVLPALHLSEDGESSRPMPSRKPLCEGCPYIPTFDALVEAIDGLGGRDRAIVVGDPGCMVRGQLPPYELIDVKNSLGSSIGTATGIALHQRDGSVEARRVIALSGDSSFLHTGLNGLIDAVRIGVPMLVIILDNGTTALSGGQPHPANAVDARGASRPAVDLATLACAAGARVVRVVDLDRGDDVRAAIEEGMSAEGVAVVIARGGCPLWQDSASGV